MDINDPNDATLDFFLTWKVEALKTFLEKRGLSKDGTKAELAALCFSANKINLPVKPSSEEVLRINQCSYEKLLQIDDRVTIPDPFKLGDGWSSEKDALSSWPPVYLSDITTFFMHNCPDIRSKHFLNDYKVGKAYEYFSCNWLKEVFYHPLGSNRYCLLRANCAPSQRVSNTDRKVWVCVEKMTGEIKSAYCSCTAGLGQTCNHVAGMLFRLEHANKMGLIKMSCTSLPCVWEIPNEKVAYGPKLISDMEVKKSKYGKSGKARPLVSQRKKQYEPLSNDDQREDPLNALGNALADILPNACLFKGFKVAATCQERPQSTRPEENNNASADDLLNKPGLFLSELVQRYKPGQEGDFIANLPTFSHEEILSLSDKTCRQSESRIWHEARKGRITASRFYSVHTKVNSIKADLTKDPKVLPLLKTLTGETGISADSNRCPRAIKHGRNMEPKAKIEYERLHKHHHDNLSVKECGLFLHETFQYLGASPDLVVSCNCCGTGLVEIKFPLVSPCSKCNPEVCICKNIGVNYLASTNHKLKSNHQYYGQIQGQIAITGYFYCDFFVYTPFAMHEERICLDEVYWIPC